jgi:hypothetical protein
MIMSEPGPPLLIVVEGVYDIHFLKAISALLSCHDGELPDLSQLEHQNQVLFFPTGGSNFKDWAQRLACLNKREFHIYDGESEPETSQRRQIVELINTRPGCAAVLSRKRALENYPVTSIRQFPSLQTCLPCSNRACVVIPLGHSWCRSRLFVATWASLHSSHERRKSWKSKTHLKN